MDDNKDGWDVLKRVKDRKQAEIERLFNQYCYPDTWFWEYSERKQAALDILNSGIFEGTDLTGHALHKKTYPVDLGHLIPDLVMKHYDVNLPLGRVFHRLEGPLDQEIISEFDEHFRFVAAIARLCGIRTDYVQNIWDDWREKVSVRAVKGEIPHLWRDIIMDEMYPGRGYAPQITPQQTAREFADIFLRYVPSTAPADRIVEWVNVTLKSLKRPTVSKSMLNAYISKKKKGTSPVTPISITE